MRKLPELNLDAVQLDQESRIIENRLQQLREDMSREKEEREKSGGFRWKSVAAASYGSTKTKENSFQKLSEGKMKMRILKGEPEGVGRPPGKPPRPPPGDQAASRKPRLRGKPCGQCEARAARLMCAECGEDYCVGCFARFHQKGALKNHRMIPVQMEIQTSISALDVVSQFKRQIEPEGSAASRKWKEAKMGQGALRSKPAPITHAQPCPLVSQPLLMKHKAVKEETGEEEHQRGPNLRGGVFDEKESEQSFQEALGQWRRQRGVVKPDPEVEPEKVLGLTENLKVSTEVFATQADLIQKRKPMEVEFKEHGLSYMERLLVKKHRRTPIEEYRPPSSAGLYQGSQMDTSRLTDEEGPGLTAEEMELQRYCASLFATATPASTPTSTSISDQDDHPTKPRFSMAELEQMAGDSAILNSTFTAESKMDNGMMTEAEWMPKIIAQDLGHQETMRSREPRQTDVPSTPPPRHPMTFNQLPRPPVSSLSPLKCRSPSIQSLQASLSPATMPQSPHSSKSRSIRVMTGSPQTKQILTKTPWSAPYQIEPLQSAIPLCQSPPLLLSSRSKSTGSSVKTPVSSRFKLTGSSLPEQTSRSITSRSPTPAPLSSMSISAGSSPPSPMFSRDSSPPELNFMSKSTGSLLARPLSSQDESKEWPPPEINFRIKSPGSSPPTPLFSRESPPPKVTSRDKSPELPPELTFEFRETRSSSLTSLSSRDKSEEVPPPELNFKDKSHKSPLPKVTFMSKSIGSSPPSPLSSRDKSEEFPPTELNFKERSHRSPPPELNVRFKSPGSSPLIPLSSRESPAPELTSMDKSPELPPELTFRSRSVRSSSTLLYSRNKSEEAPPPKLNFKQESHGTPPLTLLSSRESPPPELDFKDNSHESPPPEVTFMSKSTGSSTPSPLSSRESPPPELNFRDNSPGLPPPEQNCKDKSPGSSPPELTIRSKSTGSSTPTPLGFREELTRMPRFELPSTYPLMGSTQIFTSPEALLLTKSPQLTLSLSECAQPVLVKPPQPPRFSKLASAHSLSPTLSSGPRYIPSSMRSESASSSETLSSSLELSPSRCDGLDEEMKAIEFSSAPKAPFVPDPAIASGSDSDPELDPEMTNEPGFYSSLALCKRDCRSDRYQGLDGFLTLGLEPDTGSAPPSPRPIPLLQECEDPVERLVGGPECWRPDSSLRDCAEEQLVIGVISSQPISIPPHAAKSSRATSPAQSFSGEFEAQPRSDRNAPKSARPVSADFSPQPKSRPCLWPRHGPRPVSSPWPRPRSRLQSSLWPRPRSRAAQEILEIESVDRTEREDSVLEDEEDRLTLAGLEEEFRLMSGKGMPSCDPRTLSSPHLRGGMEAHHVRGGSRRQESSEGHTDEEEEIHRDKQNVLSLP